MKRKKRYIVIIGAIITLIVILTVNQKVAASEKGIASYGNFVFRNEAFMYSDDILYIQNEIDELKKEIEN